jgi:Xaa-Pro dipeptidase
LPLSPKNRAKKIFEQIERLDSIKTKPRYIVLANGAEPHIDLSYFYVTGFPSGLFEGSYLLATENGDVSIFTSPLEEPIARQNPEGMEIVVESDEKILKERLRRSVDRRNPIIGVNASEITYESYEKIRSIFKGAKIINAEEAVSNARSIKDESEIESTKRACEIASRVYKRIPSLLRSGMTEAELAAEIGYLMQKAGGSGLAFETIVGFGKNSALPHYAAGGAKLRGGEFVLMDYGTKFRRYCSDITRTLVRGKASSRQKKMYSVVQEALEVGKENCVVENTGQEVHSKVSQIIDSTEFKGRFIHGTGHSLGLSVHDPGPGLSKRTKTNLEPGMILTVEPGIYLPGYGGVRIEDDVLVTKGKPIVLTSASRELIEA